MTAITAQDALDNMLHGVDSLYDTIEDELLNFGEDVNYYIERLEGCMEVIAHICAAPVGHKQQWTHQAHASAEMYLLYSAPSDIYYDAYERGYLIEYSNNKKIRL